MALRKTISKRLFYACYYRLTPLHDASKLISRRDYLSPPDSAGKGFFRRFLQKRAIYHSPATVRIPEFFSFTGGEKLREKLEGNNIAAAGDRIRLDGLVPPASGISINDARKIMRLSQVEKVKEKLRAISKSSISYCEFKRICVESCGNEEQGGEFAKLLDQSGSVIVLGNIVFLHPDQVAKSMERMISESIATPDDPRYKQLTEMEKLKAIIDQKAKAQVQGELQIGLGLFLIQTLGFMRLTFWELNWDVMEPICFFVTSLHFVIGYGFFLSTSTEPTFQGFFRRRFEAKQKKLMISHNFDVNKYNQLVRACYPSRTALPCHEQGVLLA